MFRKNTLEFVRKSTLVAGRGQDWMLAKQSRLLQQSRCEMMMTWTQALLEGSRWTQETVTVVGRFNKLGSRQGRVGGEGNGPGLALPGYGADQATFLLDRVNLSTFLAFLPP